MLHFLRKLIMPWRWPWWCWAPLLLLVATGWWGGRQAWAWQQRSTAAAALQRHHLAAARLHSEACLRIWPDDPEARHLAIQATRRAGDFAEAERHIRVYERLRDKNDELLAFEWALVRAASGDFNDRIEEFLAQRLEREPAAAPWIFEALVVGYTRVYRIKEAYLWADRWIALQPDNGQAFLLRGSIHRQIGKLQKGVEDFQCAIDLDPERDDARKLLAIALIDGGRYADALTHLEELRRRTPQDADILAFQARALARGHERLAEARRLLDQLLTDRPDHALALRVRGELELADRPEVAETWLRKAIQVAPYDYHLHFLLVQALRQQGKNDEAKSESVATENLRERRARLGELLGTKMSVRPHDPALHTEIGTLLLGLGENEHGRSWLLRALQKDPGYRPAHAALAEFYEQAGDSEQATLHRRQVHH